MNFEFIGKIEKPKKKKAARPHKRPVALYRKIDGTTATLRIKRGDPVCITYMDKPCVLSAVYKDAAEMFAEFKDKKDAEGKPLYDISDKIITRDRGCFINTKTGRIDAWFTPVPIE